MYARETLLPVCLLLVVFSSSALAAYDDVCSSSTPCTAADNTVCVYSTGCTRGTCSGCATGYVVYTTGGTTSCKVDYDQTCSVAGDCGFANADCTSTKCACAATYTWDSTYQACALTAKAWGVTCGTPDVDTDCMITAANGGACNSNDQCDCKTNYKKVTGYMCQAPVLDETCDGTAGCGVRGDVDGIPDETVPDCTSSTCVCASGSVEHTLDGKKYCTSTAAPATLLDAGLSCTRNNECDSGRCKNCPDVGVSLCVKEDSSGVTIAVQPIMILILTIIAGLLQL